MGISESTFKRWVKNAGITVEYNASLSNEVAGKSEAVFEDRTMEGSKYVLKDGYGKPVKFKSDKEELEYLRGKVVYDSCLLKVLGFSDEEIAKAKKKLQQEWQSVSDQVITESRK